LFFYYLSILFLHCPEQFFALFHFFFFFYYTATTEIYTLSLHDALPIYPSLFFDDDGKVYLTSAGPSGCPARICQSEIDISTGKRLSEIKPLWSGTGGSSPEGPHLYKVNGYYYLMIAEGGTEYGHGETVARSRSPWGPFEANARNPILTHRNFKASPIQGTGHADLIQAH